MSHPDYEGIGSVEDRLVEECSELIQAICKARRFGWLNFHPNNPNLNNADDVLLEIEDVEKVFAQIKPQLDKYSRRNKQPTATDPSSSSQD